MLRFLLTTRCRNIPDQCYRYSSLSFLGTLTTRGPRRRSFSTEEGGPAGELDTKIPFSELGLKPALIQRLARLGFHTAFDIQAKTLPHSLSGRHVLGKAITGSGKTLAYALPIVHKLMSANLHGRARQPQALVITPTRELCRQVTSYVTSLCDEINCVSLYGGDSYFRQERELNNGADVVCATPGRLNDHARNGRLKLDQIRILILDEADELLRPGFREQVESILDLSSDSKQVMLFSATLPSDVRNIVKSHMTDPVSIDLTASSSKVPSSVVHQVMKVDRHNRFRVILDLLRVRNPARAIVFTPTKVQASELGGYLSRHGVSAAALHSDLSQRVRDICLDDFRRGRTKVIVATDVAARGIDVPEIDLVVQVDPPPSGVDFYIHRSGRTGRKGLAGTSVLLLSPSLATGDFLRELRKVVTVEFASPPSRQLVVETCLKSALEAIGKVKDEGMIAQARPLARKLLDAKGEDALAAAIVHISDQRRSYDGERGGAVFGRDEKFGSRNSRGGFTRNRRDSWDTGKYKRDRGRSRESTRYSDGRDRDFYLDRNDYGKRLWKADLFRKHE